MKKEGITTHPRTMGNRIKGVGGLRSAGGGNFRSESGRETHSGGKTSPALEL